MIGRNGERRSGISAQAARHDDDDYLLPMCTALKHITMNKIAMKNTNCMNKYQIFIFLLTKFQCCRFW